MKEAKSIRLHAQVAERGGRSEIDLPGISIPESGQRQTMRTPNRVSDGD